MDEIKEYIKMSKKELKGIKRFFKAIIVLSLLLVIAGIVISFKHIELRIAYEKLQAKKEELEGLTETQSSMIADLEENCKDLYIEIENLKFGGNE